MTTVSVQGLARVSESVGGLIAEVRPEQWKSPTPCTEWNVRDVQPVRQRGQPVQADLEPVGLESDQ